MSRINISHVNNMHGQWLRALNFYKTEIAILKGLLTEIAGKNSDPSMQKDVEHFENQFRIQNSNIDKLAHNIHANISAISKEASESTAGYIEGKLLEEHTKLGNETDAEIKAATELTHTFREFAAKWM